MCAEVNRVNEFIQNLHNLSFDGFSQISLDHHRGNLTD